MLKFQNGLAYQKNMFTQNKIKIIGPVTLANPVKRWV
jgi:hypothetical protein